MGGGVAYRQHNHDPVASNASCYGDAVVVRIRIAQPASGTGAGRCRLLAVMLVACTMAMATSAVGQHGTVPAPTARSSDVASLDRTADFGVPDRTVDLHAHLFMDEALGWFFHGSFADAELRADSWDDRLSSKVNAATLNDSGLGVVVVALFAHPVYRADMRQAVRRQIATSRAVRPRS